MQPLFGPVLDNYELVKLPVEPHASNRMAQPGRYWLKVTDCTVRRKNRHFYTRIRLVMFNYDLKPPFEAVYELNRKLTYKQLCAGLAKLRVVLHHPDALPDACKSVIRTVGYANCLPDDDAEWPWQATTLN